MRYVLLSIALLILSPHRAAGDHISVYSDGSGASCQLGAAGFNTTAAVVHKFTAGAMGSRFALEVPVGSTIFAFNSVFNVIGSVQSTGGAIGYGQCLQGSIFLGSIAAILTPGIVCVKPAAGF